MLVGWKLVDYSLVWCFLLSPPSFLVLQTLLQSAKLTSFMLYICHKQNNYGKKSKAKGNCGLFMHAFCHFFSFKILSGLSCKGKHAQRKLGSNGFLSDFSLLLFSLPHLVGQPLFRWIRHHKH